jgi:energy-coupling factor transport system ATP-binding protein
MLDPLGRRELLQTARTLHQKGMGILMITQYMEETVDCDRVIALRDGEVAFDGSPAEFFRNGDFVRSIGLETPEAVYIRDELRKVKPDLSKEVLTLEGLSEEFSAFGAQIKEGEELPPAMPDSQAAIERGQTRISVSNLTHTYISGADEAVHAVSEVTVEINEGEFVGIIGHTGSGKTTLVQHLNGLLTPTSGKIFVGEYDLSDKKARNTARGFVGMVFQYPEYQLFAETVLADVKFGLKREKLSPDVENSRAAEALALVGLDPERFAGKSPFELSGGEKRRAALAGVLVMRPRFLVLDEPMAGLDPAGRKEILRVLDKLRRDTGCAIIMISHSMDDVARFATRILVMDKGRLVMDGTPQEVFSHERELSNMALSLPYSAVFCRLLRENGIQAPDNICTTRALLQWLKGVLPHA